MTLEEGAISHLVQTFESDPPAYTENGALTNSSTLDAVLDLFFVAGATRNMTPTEIQNRVEKAFEQDRLLTLKLLFWARDVLEGAGERRFFRVALNALAELYGEAIAPVVPLVPVYGRWDDLLCLLDTPLEVAALAAIRQGLADRDGLAAKWLPRQGRTATRIRRSLGLKEPKAYRQLLVELSSTVEQRMCARQWDAINYNAVPSIAAKNYRKAFLRHDEDRYRAYIADLARPDSGARINAKAVFPHDIVRAVLQSRDKEAEVALLDAQWRSLPDYMAAPGGKARRIIPVVDVSGSMSMPFLKPMPLEVSISLGIYVAERNAGIFKDAFITFSAHPAMERLKGSNILEKVQNLKNAAWGMNTDLNAVFKLILRQATKHRVAPGQMPEVILIMSDMEFDEAVSGKTPFEEIQDDYARSGYAMPKVVFWNLAARHPTGNFPVIKTEPHTALISGFSPSILKPLLAGEIPSPQSVMLEVLNAERYSRVRL